MFKKVMVLPVHRFYSYWGPCFVSSVNDFRERFGRRRNCVFIFFRFEKKKKFACTAYTTTAWQRQLLSQQPYHNNNNKQQHGNACTQVFQSWHSDDDVVSHFKDARKHLGLVDISIPSKSTYHYNLTIIRA